MSAPYTAFPRSHRLLNAADYQPLFKKAKKRYSRHFIILYHPNTLLYSRLGLAISKKQLKRATDRNRIKRVIRESFRHHQSRLPSIDITVILNKEARKAGTALVKLDLRNELDNQWQQLNNISS